MAFKLFVLAAALACANAGLAPVAYSPASAVSSAYINTVAAPVAHAAYAAPVAHAAYAAPVAHAAYAAPVAAVHAPHYGSSSQSVVRSPLGGTVSHYNKAVDSAFSSVRKYDTRITNDAYAYAHAPVATYAHAAPVATYAAPVVAKTAYAAPVATYAHAAPVATYAAAPVVAKATYAAAPVAHYGAAPVVAKAAIAYSPAVAVAHMSYSGPFATYQW
ncbi:larval/pupal cuticle protein H1C-like [Atheta coriaria]|uniref:larval/pupal cuticle protein H1C-like n=1 Tax=Dalotia coriaria TaxID=877792 RepID=UPI0031F422D7